MSFHYISTARLQVGVLQVRQLTLRSKHFFGVCACIKQGGHCHQFLLAPQVHEAGEVWSRTP